MTLEPRETRPMQVLLLSFAQAPALLQLRTGSVSQIFPFAGPPKSIGLHGSIDGPGSVGIYFSKAKILCRRGSQNESQKDKEIASFPQ